MLKTWTFVLNIYNRFSFILLSPILEKSTSPNHQIPGLPNEVIISENKDYFLVEKQGILLLARCYIETGRLVQRDGSREDGSGKKSKRP